MAESDVVEIQELALNGGMNAPLPEHLIEAGTLIDLAEAGIIQNGAIQITFDPESAAFVGAFKNDLVIITEDDEIIIVKDFIPAVADGLLDQVFLLDGTAMDAPDFLEEYGMSADLAESLAEIETAAGETVSPNSVTNRSTSERFNNDDLDGGGDRTASGALGRGGRTDGRSDEDRTGEDGRSRGQPDGRGDTGTSSGGEGRAGAEDTVPDTIASTPELLVGNSTTGLEDTAIPLTIQANLTDLDGSESLMVTISGLPEGATLNAGFHDGVSNAWILSEADLADLALIPVANASGSITLTVRAIAIETNGGARSIVTDTIDVDISPDADLPILTLSDAAGLEDTAIALDISAALTDDSETLSVEISGIPDGAVLMAGGEAVTVTDGSATLTPEQLAELTITPPANSSDDFTLTVTATTADGDSTASTSVDLPVSVTGVADEASLTTSAAAGDEDTAIALDIQIDDVQPGDTASITVTGLPEGATLSAGTVNEDGSVTLTPDQLAGLTITPPANSSDDFTLGIAVTTVDGESGDAATVTDTLDVSVAGVADAATLTAEAASGDEDTAIALDISAALTDDSETLSVAISGIPEGAVLMAGGETISVTDGNATLTPDQLAELTITPPANSSEDFTLTVTATTLDGDSTASTSVDLPVSVAGVADAATLTAEAASGLEDSAIALDIQIDDVQPGDTASITVTGLPEGATLSAGTVNEDGSVTLTPDQLTGLTVTPAANNSDNFTLGFSVTTTDGQSGDTATVSDTLDVSVAGVADAATLTAEAASGLEDSAIALDISAALTDDSETLSVAISGIPEDAVLMAGGETISVTDGSATLTPDQLAELTITPPANSSDDFTLTVTATTADGDSTASTSVDLPVSVTGVADGASLTTSAASGDEDTAIALDIQIDDVQPGDTASITVTGLPEGATLSAGTVNEDGSVTLTPDQLAGLTITPPANSSDDFTLGIAVTTTDGESGDTATVSETLDVNVTGVADEASLSVEAAAGLEDSAIALDISAALTDDSETLSVEISGIPDGAVLMAGGEAISVTDGSATLTPDQLADLTITPPANSSDDFTLTVTAITVDGDSTASTSVDLQVSVTGVADDASLTTSAASGDEDTAIALDIQIDDVQPGDTASITVTGLPEGATLSAGTVNEDGSVTLTPDQLAGLTITPPANSSDNFTLGIAVTTVDGESGDAATVTDTLDVSVAGVADAATLTAEAASGDEDTAIALDISAALTDDSETLSVAISGIPEGAVLMAGGETISVTDGSATLTPDQLAELTITPPANSSDDFTLTVTATTADGDSTASTSVDLPVSVTGVADEASLTTSAAAGDEDTAIALDIQIDDVQPGDTASITVTGLPEGATLSAGTVNEDGSVTLTPEQLAGLTITPPANSSDDFTLGIAVTTVDGESGDAATVTDTLDVSVAGVADAATLTAEAASGDEDTAIALDISAALTDDSETLSVAISGIPEGAVLMAGGETISVTDGSATLTPDQLAELTITPPANSSDDFTLTVTATTADGDSTASTSVDLPVSVTGVADEASLTTSAAAGDEDTAIALDIQIDDVQPGDTASITVTGLPEGATLSAGTVNEDGSVTLTPEQLAGLTITPPANSSDDFTLGIAVTTVDGESGDAATVTETLDVSVAGVADEATLTTSAASGDEDTAIALDIQIDDVQPGDTASITVTGLPEGATLSAGTVNEDGSVTLTPEQLAGLTVTPAANSSDDFTLGIAVTTTDGESGDTATVTETLDVSVSGVADEASLSVEAAAGLEDSAIALDISAALTDDSETLSVAISGIPEGAVLMADGETITLTDGSATLTPGQLADLTITPPANSSDDFTLTVTATTVDGDSTASTSVDLPVSVTGVADAATLTTDAASGLEDSAIALDIQIDDVQPGDTAFITVTGLPEGATLSAGTVNEDGSVTLTPEQLAGLTVTPAANSSDDFTLGIAVTTTDGESGDTATVSDTLDVSVAGVADAATLTAEAASGLEDSAIALDISAALTDDSETLSVEISGIPEGAVLMAGGETISVTDGSAMLTPAQLADLTITPPADSSDDFTLTVTATTVDGDSTASTSVDLPVSVTGVADAATLTAEAASGDEDSAIALDIQIDDVQPGDTASITVTGLPEGASLSAGTVNEDGSVTLTPDQLAGLTITPPANSSDDFTLGIAVTTTDGESGDTATVTDTLDVSVAGVADEASLSVEAAAGLEDSAIALDISAALTDDSETLSVEISGIPEGAVLMAGGETISVTDGSATLTPDQLADLTITPPANSSDDFTLTVTATTTDGDSTASTSVDLPVSVTGVADDASLTISAASGDEDSAIALDIQIDDVQPGDTASITVTGLPEGATLSAGTVNEDGSVTLTPEQLAGLTVTPPANSSDDFTLGIAVTTTDGESGDTATVTDTLDVSVTGVADEASLSVEAASGLEDSAIALDIQIDDVQPGDTASITVTGLPEGATLSAGTVNEDGSVTLTPEQLAGLTVTPASNSSDDFTLGIAVTTTDGQSGDTATVSDTLDVSVAGVADAATLTAETASGLEDSAIALDIQIDDVQPGDTASITVTGLPEGATLSAGTVNEDGSVTLTPDQLAGLTVTPPANSSDDFTLGIAVTTVDGESGDTATVTETLDVSVAGVADAATLTAEAASGLEDSAIALDISAALTDDSETLSVEISGIPEGAVLMAGGETITVTEGSATLTPDQLADLTITPPANSSDDFTLTVTATTLDGDSTASTSVDLPVSVTGVADAASLSVEAASGLEDSAIALDIQIDDVQPGDTASITVIGLPEGATLSAGTVNEDGSVTLTPDQLAGLTVTPPANSSDDFTLGIAATTTDGESGDTATVTDTLDVSVAGVADAATLTAEAASGDEDSAIALDIQIDDVQPGDTASITVTGLPEGATLSAGTVNEDGSVTLTPDQLAGLTITPPADSSDDFTLGIAVTTTDGESGDTATVTDTLDVSVTGIADEASLSVEAAAGLEDSAIALDISAALTDDSETLSVAISGIPEGAVLMSGGEAVTVTDGSATLTPEQLADLSITPPANSSDDFTLTVTATTVDGDSTASTSVDLPVSVTGVADDASLTTSAASGDEDTAIALDIQIDDVQPGDTASITVTGLPEGASLSAGTVNEDGSVTLTPDQLAGLTVTPPADSSDDFTLGIAVTTTDGESGDTATVTDTLDVSVAGVADEASLSVEAAAGLEDSAIALDISAALTDDSETLSVEISGIPEGAVLMAGGETISVTDGSATLTPDQLADLTITPPANSSDDFTLTVTATTLDGDSTANVVGVIEVSVAGVADDPDLIVSAVSGGEDSSILLDISAALTDDSETLAVEISGIPEGAILMAGDTVIDITDGSATLTPDQLADLSITPPANSSNDFTLTVTAISTDGDSTATTVGTIPVTLDAVADNPELTVEAASGDEDTEITLDISAALTDEGETLSVEISGIPNGATLTASGIAIAVTGGVATLTAGQLDALSITPPANSSNDFTLTVTAISTDGESTATTVGTIPVTIDAVADAPSLETQSASGSEDQPIPLTIQATTPDAGETLSIEITGIPEGAVLMSGDTVISISNGTATLSPAQLTGLTITPPEHSDQDFELSVTVTATDGNSTASDSGTLPVSVDPEADTPSLTLAPSVSATLEGVTVPLTLPEGISGALIDGTAPYELPAGSGLNGQIFDSNGSLNNLNGVDSLIAASGADVTFNATNIDYSGGSNMGGFLGSDGASATGTTGASADTFAVKIVGYIKIEAGSHDFNVTTDDGFRLKIGGQTVTEFDGNRGSATSTSTFTATEDGLYPIEIVYWENGGDQVLFVEMDGETIGGDILFSEIPSGLSLNEDGYYSIPDTVETSTELTISDLPEGAVLSAGVQNPDGTWTVTPEEADGITVTFPDGGIHAITATVTDSNGNVVSSQVIAAGQDPVVTVALDIQSALADLDGSETLSISISDLPTGAVLSAGIVQSDGSILLTAEELDGLTVTMPVGTDDFDLTVTATSTDGGETASISQTISVDVPEIQGETITGTTGTGVITGTAGDDIIYGSSTASNGSSGSGGSDGGTETPINAVFHFKLEDTTWGSNETVTDSINGVTGTARGGTGTASGANGNAAQFDGNGDYIEVPHSEAMELTTGTFSLNFLAWNNGTLASKDSTDYDDGGHFDLRINSNREVELRVQTEDETFTLSGGNIDWHSWHSASVTWDGETVTLYVNGEAVDSVETDWNLSANENPWTFGASQINSGDNVANNLNTYLDGKIDNPTLLDAPLTADQIAGMHSSGIPATLDEGLTTTTESDPQGPQAALLSEDFSNGSGSFTYSDGVFGTSNGYYESGAHGGSAGQDGGGLSVTLGGQNNNAVSGMSGGWTTTINVPEDTVNATLTFSYRMVYPANSEADEAAEVRVALDGSLIGANSNDYIMRVAGDGDSGVGTQDSGWQTVTINLGSLSAGSHSITLGGLYEGKTTSDEEVQLFFDAIELTVPQSIEGDGETIFGGAGDDVIFAGAGNDVIDGGSGNDTINLTANQSSTVAGISPISYWKLEETNGTSVSDSVGNNHGTTSGGTVLDFSGNFGSGADLDGNNDQIDIPHNSSMELANGSLTFSFNGNQQQNTLVSKGEGGDDPGEFDISTRNNGKIRFNFTDDDGDNVRLEGGSINWGEWNSVTITWGDEGLQLWLNGSMVASNSGVTNGLEENDESLKFGANEDNDDEFDGAIDDIALFNSQLSAEDISTIASDGVQNLIDTSVSHTSAGGNFVDGGSGDDTVIAGAGADTIDGGDGIDTIDYSNSDAAVMIDFENGVVSGGHAQGDQISNFENIVGSDFDDTLRGDDGNNRIDGGAGNDVLRGGGGADVFVLGSSEDGIDTIVDFNLAEGDRLDISSVVNMNDIDDIANYVKLEDDGSGNTTVMVNTSGDGAAENFSAVANLEGVTGLDVSSILQDHNPGGEAV